MFRGLYDTPIDSKGRTSMPARIREVLSRMNHPEGVPEVVEADSEVMSQESFVLTTGIDRCLVVYSMPEWTLFEAKLGSLSQFDPAVVQLKRIYVAGAIECTLDKHGRLMIPPMLREYAGLTRDIVWAGMVKTTELWAKEHWKLEVETSRADRVSISRALTELGL